MKLVILKLTITVENFLRKCGYVEISNPYTKEKSFARSIHAGRFYPRFHAYLEKSETQTIFNLHMDSKKPSYEGSKAHSGEYDSPIVNQEAERIKMISERFLPANQEAKQLGFPKNKPWWRKLLG